VYGDPFVSELLVSELIAVDEDEIAGVEPDRPPACRPDNELAGDVDTLPGQVAEVLHHDAAILPLSPGIHPNGLIDENGPP